MADRSERSRITAHLASHPKTFVLFATASAFACYFCTYAFRKPFSAATFEGVPLFLSFDGRTLEPKTLFVIAQIFGYCVSKFIGTRLCTELRREDLAKALIITVLLGMLTLLGFATLPLPLKVIAIFLNGIPLGVIWGFIVRYLEGRSTSELLLAGLSSSYILSSGEVKRVGRWLIESGVSEFWMPFATGALFLLPFLASVGLLSLLPAPSAEDEALRIRRQPMDRERRWAFMRRFFPGMILLCIAYLFLTAYRDFRDNYQADLFIQMGIEEAAAFSRTERPIAFFVMIVMALLFLIRKNRTALAVSYGIMISGLAMMGGSTWLYQSREISGEMWMIASGLGAYLAYVPFGSLLFDRTIAVTRFQGTAVFAIYVADALGYTGSVGVQLYKDLFAGDESRLDFFMNFTYGMAAVGIPLMAGAMIYFLGQKPEPEPATDA